MADPETWLCGEIQSCAGTHFFLDNPPGRSKMPAYPEFRAEIISLARKQ